jgi:hypothetical protein
MFASQKVSWFTYKLDKNTVIVDKICFKRLTVKICKSSTKNLTYDDGQTFLKMRIFLPY